MLWKHGFPSHIRSTPAADSDPVVRVRSATAASRSDPAREQ
ncbi:MAG: hypothetical protein U0528_01605 [Anaerolineae bacterium]